MHNGRTPLYIFDGESVTSQRHYREMILDHVRIFRVTVDSDFLFMDDNEHPHRSVEVSATLQSENILRTQWHVYSPDLTPIEHAWDALGRRVAQRTFLPRAVQELKTAFREMLGQYFQELLDSLVKIMGTATIRTLVYVVTHICITLT
ncbi:transposable element Tcb2 transposase [Trichonephila clavipes]|nr:transposable element Tcb2 transposase [Trichonephila clavipes]